MGVYTAEFMATVESIIGFVKFLPYFFRSLDRNIDRLIEIFENIEEDLEGLWGSYDFIHGIEYTDDGDRCKALDVKTKVDYGKN